MRTGILTPRPLQTTEDANGHTNQSRTPSTVDSDRTGVPQYSQSELPASSYSSVAESLSEEQDALSSQMAVGESGDSPAAIADSATSSSPTSSSPASEIDSQDEANGEITENSSEENESDENETDRGVGEGEEDSAEESAEAPCVRLVVASDFH